ncbi:MAG: PaaI family thioesterase [Deltaproteobacteria bacterium]
MVKLDMPFPNPPFWDLLGIEVTEMNDGRATLTMPFDRKITQPYGIVHGGALFTLADSAAAVALVSLVDLHEKRFLTVEMKINYLAPVSGGIIEARARVIKLGRTISPVDVEVFAGEILVAKAISTYIILKNDKKS